MIEYKENYSTVRDDELELKEAIEDLISTEGWSTDELIELLGECEFALSHFSGRIEELKVRGFKRLYNVITGINRRNKIRVLDDIQQIQRISITIQKILMRRIDLVSSALINLNDKLNTTMFWTADTINNLTRQLSDTDITARLVFWQNNAKNRKTKSGKKYIEVPDGIKILLAVSDLFSLVSGVSFSVPRHFWETTLQNLGVQDQIDIVDFYEDIIQEKEYLSLYIRSGYNYEPGNISDYGCTIYKIADFYQDEHVIKLAEKRNESMDDMCREIYVDEFCKEGIKIDPTDLCEMLLDDLKKMYLDYQERIKEQERFKEQERIKEQERPKAEDTKEYSVLRLTPEGFWLFKKGKVSCSSIDYKSDYSFKDEKTIKAYLDNVSPYLVTAPIGYADQCMPEIKGILSNQTQYVPLADYYMYLWFQNKDVDGRKNQKILFIEYYAHDLYVSGYEVNASGDDYRRRFSKLVIPYNRAGNNIIKDIMNESQRVFSSQNSEDILIFRTFYIDKHIIKKLSNIDVDMVDDTWESILKTSNDKLGVIVQDIIDKSSKWL